MALCSKCHDITQDSTCTFSHITRLTMLLLLHVVRIWHILQVHKPSAQARVHKPSAQAECIEAVFRNGLDIGG